jgi:hypothetical protein
VLLRAEQHYEAECQTRRAAAQQKAVRSADSLIGISWISCGLRDRWQLRPSV